MYILPLYGMGPLPNLLLPVFRRLEVKRGTLELVDPILQLPCRLAVQRLLGPKQNPEAIGHIKAESQTMIS